MGTTQHAAGVDYVLNLEDIDATQLALGRRQGRLAGRALAGRRRPRAARLLRDGGRLPADRGARDRGSARSPVTAGPGRPRRDPHPERGDPPGHRSDRDPPRSGSGDHRRQLDGGRLRRPLERDRRGPADGLLRGPAGLVSERRRPRRDPRARQPLLGLAVHRAGGELPHPERLRPPQGADGRRRAADGRRARGRRPLHGGPGHVQPQRRRGGGGPRPRRGAGLRPGQPRSLHGAGRRDRRQGARPASRPR